MFCLSLTEHVVELVRVFMKTNKKYGFSYIMLADVYIRRYVYVCVCGMYTGGKRSHLSDASPFPTKTVCYF